MIEGIDVSNNNGAFNWPAWRGHIGFAEVKATQSVNFRDPLFSVNWAAAAKLGVYRFAYHYGIPSVDPAEQAQCFTNYVREHGLSKHDQFVLDLETNSGMRPVDVSFWGHVFCTEMNRLNPGHRILVQVTPAFAEAGNCAKLGPWHLWLMSWDVPRPVMPVGPWHDWALWQYAEGSGKGPDRDRFNGSEETLSRFCETTGP